MVVGLVVGLVLGAALGELVGTDVGLVVGLLLGAGVGLVVGVDVTHEQTPHAAGHAPFFEYSEPVQAPWARHHGVSSLRLVPDTFGLLSSIVGQVVYVLPFIVNGSSHNPDDVGPPEMMVQISAEAGSMARSTSTNQRHKC